MAVAKIISELGERDKMCTGTHDFIPAPESVRARMIYNTLGGVAMNVLHFRKDGGWNTDSMNLLAAELKAWYHNDLRTVVNDQTALVLIEVTDISVEDGPQVSYTTALPEAGAVNNPALPSNVTLAIKFLTGNAGRSYRGRAYQIGLYETAVVGDSVGSTYLGDSIDAWNALLEGEFETEGLHLAIVSYCNNKAWRAEAAVTDVTSITADSTVDTQRRRLLGHGM